MRTTARIAAALLSTTIVLGASATSAFAQTTTVKDKPSDVLSFADQTTDERGTQLGYTASKQTGIDLRSMRVKHTTKSVAVNLKFADLDPSTTVFVSFRTNGSSQPIRLFVNTGENKGTVFNAYGTKRCTVPISHRYGTSGSINAVIKRSCLGTPKRIKASASAVDPGYFGNDTAFLIDPLSPTKVRGESWSRWLSPS